MIFYCVDRLAAEKPDILTGLPRNISGAITGDSIMKYISLTKGKRAIVDDDMFDYLNQWKWCASKSGELYCARAWIDGKMIRMHRLIMRAKPNQEIDHKNHNTLDNRIENLRFCTHAQNKHNSRPYKNGLCKYKGVHWYKQTKKWEVKITLNRKKYHVGYFHSVVEAAKAYDKKARELFGEFAYCNFK